MNTLEKPLAPPNKPRMLLVEDDEVLRHTLEAVLKFNGFIVRTADGVTGALRLIGSEPFDLLLTDLHMPRAGDGFTVVERNASLESKNCMLHPQRKHRRERIQQKRFVSR